MVNPVNSGFIISVIGNAVFVNNKMTEKYEDEREALVDGGGFKG